MGFYGSIDLTKLGHVVRQHPELVRVVNMSDGTQHQFLNIDISEKRQADQYGCTAYMKVSCKQDQQKHGLNYYLGDLKPSRYSSQQPQQHPAQQAVQHINEDTLPF